jgi:acetyl esterase/lipase
MLRNLILSVFLFCSTLLFAQNDAELKILETFECKKTVIYKTVGGIELDMLILYPDSSKLKDTNPWMMHIHGGGWAGGSKYNMFKPPYLRTVNTLLDSGVVCVTIQYRLARDTSNAYDAVVDAKDAARFLLLNADKYKLDKENYGAWGGSAGGHLSLVTTLGANSDFYGDKTLAGISPQFKCLVSYFPFTSCLNPAIRPGSIFEDEKLFVRLLGAPLGEKPELEKLLSPSELLKKNSPPILLIHGDKDTVLPIINSEYLMEIAQQKKSDVELLTIKNAGHSFKGANISPSMEELNDYSAQFILSHLKK